MRSFSLVAVGTLLVGALGAGGLAGCNKSQPCDPTVSDCPSDAGLPPYVCTSPQVACSNPVCTLQPGVPYTDYLSAPDVQQWYCFTTKAGADARSLVSIIAGFDAPGTPVDLSVNLLTTGATPTSLGNGVDNHGSGPPQPVSITVPFAQSATQLVVSVNDSRFNTVAAAYDPNNPFTIVANNPEDPDPHTPGVPTPLTFSAGANGIQTATATGFLSTTGRQDAFQFNVPAGNRQLIYLQLTGGCDGGQNGQCTPPPAYLMSYVLKYDAGIVQTDAGPAIDEVTIAEDHITNPYLPINLVTSRFAGTCTYQTCTPQPGQYEVDVEGYVDPTTGLPAQGDIRVQYNLTVDMMQDMDTNEPNDSISSAYPIAMPGAPGATQGSAVVNRTGRISYEVDPDWYLINLPAYNSPSLLHYKITPLTTGGRFPPLTPPPFHRQALLFQQAPVATCFMDPAVCPYNFDDINDLACGNEAAVQNYCQTDDPPDSGMGRCLLSDREEDVAYSGIRNFEGVWEVPPHGSTMPYYLLVQSAKQLWADDMDYQVTVDWYQETAAQTKFWSGGARTVTVAMPFSQDGTWAQVPANPTPNINGSIAYGYGRLFNNDPFDGGGIRADCDYDAIPTQVDNYELDFPAVLPTPPDEAWELQWSVTNAAGQTVHDLVLEVTFCDASGSGGATDPCSPAQSVLTGMGLPQDIVYNQGAGQWFNDMGQFNPMAESPWTQTVNGVATTTVANQYGCLCFQPNYVMGKKVFIGVAGVDRDSYQPATYTVSTALAPYSTEWAYSNATLCPQPGALPDGGASGCFFQ